MTELGLRDIRCFAGNQFGRLARISLLVGPNGVGKSTFLGCYKTLTSLANLHDLDDENHFDKMPYCMGGFDTIARTGCPDFSVSGTFANHCHDSVRFDFCSAGRSDPREQRVHIAWQGEPIKISLDLATPESFLFENPRFSFRLNRSHISYTQISTWLSRAARFGYLPFNGDTAWFRRQSDSSVVDKELVAFSRFVSFFRSELPLQAKPAFNVFALDPSLERRQRIYPNKPQLLPSEDAEAMASLANFGKQLGLWKDVRIRSSKRGFAIMVRTTAGTRNLLDVGHGVYSMLPLARALYKQPPSTVFLLQEPEVYLHPEAQANLAQFMVESQKGFIIETHSDHFADRLRICVMLDQLAPEDLSILYFDPLKGGKTAIHSISVDESANLLNVPNGFRSFFNRETNHLLGFED